MKTQTAALLLALLCVSQALADDPRVVVVGIDAKTQKELGAFGGSYRGLHAQLIEKLNASGVRTIAFDVYFPENAERVAETAALAKAADASRAPVTIGFLAQEQQDGTIATLDNAAVFKGTKVSEGAVMARRELFIKQDANGLYGETGAFVVAAEAAGRRSLIETALSRGGIADRKRLESLGVIEDVTVGWNGAEVKVPALRPKLGAKPLTLSYVDVLRKKPHPALKGAIVIIGMTDGVQDVLEAPDPARPKLKKVSGVYLHAALAERIVKAVAADDARRAQEEATEKGGQGGDRSTGLNRVLDDKLGKGAKKVGKGAKKP
ncbi:MAG: CHASE2 domain-containing protein [Planctomycetes bacterium]|nr:CHASE2 domain-containing protein [Planctomycetota bacterium]